MQPRQANERLSIGSSSYGLKIDQLLALTRAVEIDDRPALENASVRERLADFYVRSEGMRYTMYRTLTALSKGQTSGPEASMGKAVTAPLGQEMAKFAMDLLGANGIAAGAQATAGGLFQHAWLSAPGGRVAGGTDEIMLNIVAERVLGLPADVRVDKDIPFNQLAAGR